MGLQGGALGDEVARGREGEGPLPAGAVQVNIHLPAQVARPRLARACEVDVEAHEAPSQLEVQATEAQLAQELPGQVGTEAAQQVGSPNRGERSLDASASGTAAWPGTE